MGVGHIDCFLVCVDCQSFSGLPWLLIVFWFALIVDCCRGGAARLGGLDCSTVTSHFHLHSVWLKMSSQFFTFPLSKRIIGRFCHANVLCNPACPDTMYIFSTSDSDIREVSYQWVLEVRQSSPMQIFLAIFISSFWLESWAIQVFFASIYFGF